MTRLIIAAALACAVTSPAGAQIVYNQPARGGGYGGGLIEMMMTGRVGPGPQRAGAGLRAAPVAADPMDEAAANAGYGPRRYAALPGEREMAGLARTPDPAFARQVVPYGGGEAPGTIVVDTPSRFLYLVQGGGRAIRYGIGVGRPGFEWSGMKTVTMKREWPDWTPPAQMLLRRPDLPRHMAGGPDNPLGARALYLGSSLYRIHGTNEPHTIGTNVSSGCIRMMNDDVVDLYDRVAVGSRVKVI